MLDYLHDYASSVKQAYHSPTKKGQSVVKETQLEGALLSPIPNSPPYVNMPRNRDAQATPGVTKISQFKVKKPRIRQIPSMKELESKEKLG